MRGGAGHRLVSAAGRSGLHRLPDGPEQSGGLIASGRVQVNWRECTKPDKLLVEGDTVSARGFGKFQLAEVGGVTKKGRTAIVVKRYV